MSDAIISGYESAAPDLIDRFLSLSPDRVLAPVLHLLPRGASRIADIGAGTGTVAAWLAGKGHTVHAVEPVRAFRVAGQARFPDCNVVWHDDRLPDLASIRPLPVFYMALMIGVWQHLDDAERAAAMPVLASLLAPGAQLILSVRHGPGAPSRRCFPTRDRDVAALARANGLTETFRATAASVQPENRAAKVTWTWLAFARNCVQHGATHPL